MFVRFMNIDIMFELAWFSRNLFMQTWFFKRKTEQQRIKFDGVVLFVRVSLSLSLFHFIKCTRQFNSICFLGGFRSHASCSRIFVTNNNSSINPHNSIWLQAIRFLGAIFAFIFKLTTIYFTFAIVRSSTTQPLLVNWNQIERMRQY